MCLRRFIKAIATVTLGGSGSSQKTDGITGTVMKQFYLQYTFPPSCVGEVCVYYVYLTSSDLLWWCLVLFLIA